MHVEDRAGAFGDARRHARTRQSDRSPRGAGMETGRARSHPLHRPARRTRLQSLPIRDRKRGGPRDRAITFSASLPRCRGIRDYERDDAVDSGVVRQCQRHDSGTARFLPLAVCIDCAARCRLCGPAVLSFCVAGIAHAQRQYGRSDQHRCDARAYNVCGRTSTRICGGARARSPETSPR